MPDSRTPPNVAALAREALELCDRRPPELLYLREDVRMTELLRDLAHAALPSPSPVVEQQVAEAMKALDDAVYSWLTATRDAERPWPLPSAAQVRDEAAKEYKAARARLTSLLSGAPADDTARLDWLEQNEASIRHHCVSGRQADGSDADAEWWQVDVFDEEGIPDGHAEETLRAAIDAARFVSPAEAPHPEPRDG